MNNSVELLGHYGGDKTHAMSAWTSTSRDYETKKTRMPALLKRLAEDGHHTPFEKSTLHFLVRCDTASHIHLLKHRIGVSINGESARYKELAEDNCYVPHDWSPAWQDLFKEHTVACYRLYHDALSELVAQGMSRKRAKESARYFLPYANQLTLDVSFNFRSFMHFLKLRLAPEAQNEIAEIASDMLWCVRDTGDFEHSLRGFGHV